MNPPPDVASILAPYTRRIDASLAGLFVELPELPLYQHLAYFMGFRNADLSPGVVYGGKRFRSALMLMLGEGYGTQSATLPLATALELFHNFTLIHDDVVDKDTHRRGRPTVWYQFGVDHAINDGDAQMLIVAELLGGAAATIPTGPKTQEFMLRQFRKVVEGQYLDFMLTNLPLDDARVTEEAYLTMIERKTSDLIIAATGGAGILADVADAEQAALITYGRSLGLAYQICDDVISIWADTATTGKRTYGDVRERKKTLPILFAYRTLGEAQQAELLALYTGTAEIDDAACVRIIKLLDQVDTVPAMRAAIDTHANAAKAAAGELSVSSELKETLITVVDSLLPSV
jgi:geranylgeranyl diphosphate synthase, type I